MFSLEARFEGSLARQFLAAGSALREAADEAVLATTDDVLFRFRAEVASALTPRAANTLSRKLYPNSGQGLAGYIAERWAAPGGFVLAKFAAGGPIRSKTGGYVAHGLPTAQRFRRGRRLTLDDFEQATGLTTRLVPLGGDRFLVLAERARIDRKGIARRIAGVRRRRALGEDIPVFILKRETIIPRRINLRQVEAFGDRRLGSALIENFEKRRLLN